MGLTSVHRGRRVLAGLAVAAALVPVGTAGAAPATDVYEFDTKALGGLLADQPRDSERAYAALKSAGERSGSVAAGASPYSWIVIAALLAAVAVAVRTRGRA